MAITIVQLDLKTQKMIPVVSEPVSGFQIEGEQLYYSKPTFAEDGNEISHQFYKMPVDGGQCQTIGEAQENTDRFFVRDGQIFPVKIENILMEKDICMKYADYPGTALKFLVTRLH